MADNLFITHLDTPRVFAATTVRSGGVSHPPFDELNLGFQTGDDHDLVRQNWSRLRNQLPLRLKPFVLTYQSHSTVIQKVSLDDAGKGTHAFEDGIRADALYTTEKHLPIGVFHADCVPIFLTHTSLPLIAIIHAGTPGTINRVTSLVIDNLCTKENVLARDFTVSFGPALDFVNQPLTTEDVDRLLTNHPHAAPGIKMIAGSFYLDTPLLNYLQLIERGVLPENIRVHPLDTFANPKLLYSAARDVTTGRHVSFMYLK
jgi:polyphenol oxidase